MQMRSFETGFQALPSRAGAIYPAIQVPEVVTPYVVEHPVNIEQQLMVFPKQQAVFETPKPKQTIGAALDAVKFNFIEGVSGLITKFGGNKLSRQVALATVVFGGLGVIAPAMAGNKESDRKAKIEHVGANLGAEASGRAVTPFNSLPNLVLSKDLTESKKVSGVDSDLTGPQIQVVCASPSNAAPNIDRCKQAASGMQAYMVNPEHGAEGLTLRLAIKGNAYSVIPVQLEASTTEITNMASTSERDPNAPGNLQDYMVNQIHKKVSNDPSVHYAVFLTGIPNQGRNGDACGPARVWNGMNVPLNGVNRNVMTTYITDKCDLGTSSTNSPYHGFKLPEFFALQKIVQNEGFLNRCHPGFAGNGFSNIPNDLANLNTIWWQSKIDKGWLISQPNCPGLDLNPRMAWIVRASHDGKGQIKYYSSGKEIDLEPGNRLRAGMTVEARYDPATGERLAGWNGDCSGSKCEFLVDEMIQINADAELRITTTTTTTTPKPKNEMRLLVIAKGPMFGRIALGTLKKGKLQFEGGTRKIDETLKKGQLVAIETYVTKERLPNGRTTGVMQSSGCEENYLPTKRLVPVKYRSDESLCWKLLDGKSPGNTSTTTKVERATITFGTFPPKIK